MCRAVSSSKSLLDRSSNELTFNSSSKFPSLSFMNERKERNFEPELKVSSIELLLNFSNFIQLWFCVNAIAKSTNACKKVCNRFLITTFQRHLWYQIKQYENCDTLYKNIIFAFLHISVFWTISPNTKLAYSCFQFCKRFLANSIRCETLIFFLFLPKQRQNDSTYKSFTSPCVVCSLYKVSTT